MKKRILMVFDKGLGRGGVESVIMSIVRNLSDTYTFDLLTNTNQTKDYDAEFISYGGKIFKIPFYEGKIRFLRRADYYIRGAYFYIKCLMFFRKNKEYEIIHCHNSTEGGIVLSAAKRAGIPVRIMHSHATFVANKGIRNIITSYYRRLITKNATHTVGCSKVVLGLFENEEKCKIIYNAYDDKRFCGAKAGDVSADNFKMIQVGRYDEIKNQVFSIGVLKELLTYIPNATLDLVGSNDQESELRLKNSAKELGVLDNITFNKAESDIPKLLSEANVFLFPSQYEGFGIALIEAQAMGLKCYASSAVPTVTNCGAVEYMPLSIGEKEWAKKIAEDYRNGLCDKKNYDCTAFSTKKIMLEYESLYRGD